MYPIIRRENFSQTTFLWEVHAPDVAQSAQPGHFVMLRLYDGGERIPLTVADYDRGRGTITLVVQTLGKTTQEMRDDYKQGDRFSDFVGPLGLPQHIGKVGHVVLVGGGLGVAPVFPQLRAFKEAGNRTTAIMGFRTKDLVFWENRFGGYADNLVICTDDGSSGRKSLVTEPLKEVLESRADISRVWAIGPAVMMKFCAAATKPFNVPTIVSLNTIMIDGTGMCGGCRVVLNGGAQFVCVDGPEFDAHQVDWELLLQRLSFYRAEEKESLERWEAHRCNLDRAFDTLTAGGSHA